MPSMMATLGLNTGPFKSGLAEAQGEAKGFGSGFSSSMGSALTGMLARFGSVAFIEESIRKTIDYGDKIDELSDRTGISTEALQRWDYVMKQNGGTLESAVGFMEKLATSRLKAMQGSESQIDAFKRLGISMKEVSDLSGTRNEDMMFQISEAFKVGDPQSLIADLRTIGGRGAGEMVTAFRSGVQDQMAAAPVMKDQVIGDLGEISDALKSGWSHLTAWVGNGVATVYEGLKLLVSGTVYAVVAVQEAIETLWSTGSFKKAGKQLLETFDSNMQDYARRQSQAQEDRERKQEAARKLAGIGDLETSKADKERERTEDRISKLKQRTAEITRETALSEMTAAQRVAAIQAEIQRIKTGRWRANTEEENAMVDERLAELNRDLSRAQKEAEREAAKEDKAAMKADRFRAPEVNALQKIGAYVDPRLAQAGDDARQTAQNTSRAVELLSDLVKNSRQTRF